MNCRSTESSSGGRKQEEIDIQVQICSEGNASESNQLIQRKTAAGDEASAKQK